MTAPRPVTPRPPARPPTVDGAAQPPARPPAPAAGDAVRWSAADAPTDPYASGRVARAPYGAASRAATPPWGARADAVARWCLSRRPLAPAVLALLGPTALAPWIGRTPPDTLGALLRAALGTGEGGLVALYDALAASNTPPARALLARILGAPFLLVTVRVRQGALVGADARACTDEREALGLLAALGAHDPGRGALTRGLVIGGAASGDPVALLPDDDASVLTGGAPAVGDGDALLSLPLLDLDVGTDVEAGPAIADAAEPHAPPAAAWPGLVGGASGGSASPFLEAFDPRLRDDEAHGSSRTDDEAADEDGPARDADAEDGSDAGTGAEDDEADDADDADGASPFLAEALGGVGMAPDGRPGAPPLPAAEPQPLDAEVSAAALARLSARTAATVRRVTASVATDDGVLDTVVDIVPWLAEASEQELRALVMDRWRGEEAAELARALAEEDPEVEEVVRQARRTEAELVVEIDGTAAAAWLAQHRPALAERLGLLPDD